MKKSPNIVNEVAKHLRHEVTFNKLKPGVHLKESEIAKKFSISRVPVREAFRILQSEGYLKVVPNKGCYVRKMSNDYILETGIVYRLLAPVVLEKAIPNYTARTYKEAEAILSKIEKSSEFSQVGYLLWDFAKLIYSPSKMTFMVRVFDDIYMHSIRLLNEFFETTEFANFKVTAHWQFINLCKENRKEDAIILWCDFIDKMKDLVAIKEK